MNTAKKQADGRLARQVVIYGTWCKGCGICVALCPKDALSLDGKQKAVWAKPEECIQCGLCELRCPDLAIELVEEESLCSAT